MKGDDGAALEAIEEMVRVSEELGLYNYGPTVCMSHLRFTPCRRGKDTGTCSFSSREEDVERVARYQASEMRGKRTGMM